MARIVYALSGQGRGHTSRVMAIRDGLRQRGHDVLLCCGGTAREVFEEQGEQVLPVPSLCQVLKSNQVRYGATFFRNAPYLLRRSSIAGRLVDVLRAYHPDLLITDFEAFSPVAAQRLGVPVLSFNHQQVVTETQYQLPARYWLQAFVTSLVIRLIAPPQPAHTLLTSFFFPPLKDPRRATFIAPVIRPEVQVLAPKRGEHVLVYFNQAEGSDAVLEVLRSLDAAFILYNFPRPERPEEYPNLVFKEPSLQGFLEDLAGSRAVICTAGFTLISEALYLGKPLLVLPNRGIFEQTLNALFLQAEGLGTAVLDRPLTRQDVDGFLARCDAYQARLSGRNACGNKEALACIEGVLFGGEPQRDGKAGPATAAPAGVAMPLLRAKLE